MAAASSAAVTGAGTAVAVATLAPAAGASPSAPDVFGNVVPKRPGGGLKWSEVCERVQQPDGSVRTSPPFKSGGTASAASPPRPRVTGLGLGHHLSKATLSAAACSSRGGSSRGGSSGKSSRSSSRDPLARDADISSRCSSGGGWDTSTQSSEPSRPRTPIDIAPSPSGSNALFMPDPIRTMPMLPPALFDDEQCVAGAVEKGDGSCVFQVDPPGPPSWQRVQCSSLEDVGQHPADSRLGMPLKRDPYGRDGPRRSEARGEWTVEPLAKYLKGVATQIEANLQKHGSPTAEKLDAFVHRLVANTQRQTRHAPKKVRHALQSMFAKRLVKFWNFVRNEKIRSTTPEELKVALVSLGDCLNAEFGLQFHSTGAVDFHSQPVMPIPIRGSSCFRKFGD